jgi:hypothetical protein
MKSTCLALVVAVGCVAIAGCGGDARLNAKGRVLRDGQPFTVPADDHVRVTFYQLTPEGTTGKNSYAAAFNNADGTFTAVGPDGRGIPPGKYRVCVEHLHKRNDMFRGAYNTDTTPFVFDIGGKAKELVIELDKKG